tara:strand:- start:4187 stop:4801 length:615 start_codon:yes stop_codon:yes gene_type:complete
MSCEGLKGAALKKCQDRQITPVLDTNARSLGSNNTTGYISKGYKMDEGYQKLWEEKTGQKIQPGQFLNDEAIKYYNKTGKVSTVQGGYDSKTSKPTTSKAKPKPTPKPTLKPTTPAGPKPKENDNSYFLMTGYKKANRVSRSTFNSYPGPETDKYHPKVNEAGVPIGREGNWRTDLTITDKRMDKDPMPNNTIKKFENKYGKKD